MRLYTAKIVYLLISIFLSIEVNAQTRLLQGKIMDKESGKPMDYAAIIVVESPNIGGLTDSAGGFQLNVPESAFTLKVESVGYDSLVVKVKPTDTYLNLTMSAVSQKIKDVVITGYTTQSVLKTTGSVSTISADKLASVPNTSFDVALQGTAPGIYVGTPTGQPGEAGRVTIRGLGSINGNTNPLYVVDGVYITAADFAALNSADFASITVLKDAASTGQYGANAANGVIVVTTKDGKLPDGKKMQVTFTTEVGFSQTNTHDWDQMNTSQRLQFEALIKDPTLPGWEYSSANPTNLNGTAKTAADYAYGTHFLDSLSKINTNWLKQILRTGVTNSDQLTLAGRDEIGHTNYYISAGYIDQQGTVGNSGLDRYTLRSNVQNTIGRLKSTLNIGVGYADITYVIAEGGGGGTGGINAGGGGFSVQNPIAALYYALPYESPNGPTGPGMTGANILNEIKNDYYKEQELKLIASDKEEFRILPQLKAIASGGLEYTHAAFETYFSPTGWNGQQVLNGGNGSFDDSTESTIRLIANGGLRYLQEWGHQTDKNEVEANLMAEVNRFYGFNEGFTGYGIQSGLTNPGAGITQGTSTNNYIPTVTSAITNNNMLVSQIFLLRYSYGERFSFQGSFRVDGSSQVAEENRYKPFYAIGGSWNIRKEKFLQSVNKDIMTTLRLRGSIGVTGNSGGFQTDFGYKTLYYNTNYAGQSAYAPINPANPDYNWEINTTGDIGIDFGFLKDRLYGSFDFYDRITSNLFVNQNLSLTTGYKTVEENGGKDRNIGAELALFGDVIKTKKLILTIGFNFSYNKNTVLSVGNGQNQIFLDPTLLAQDGLPLGTFYLVRWYGVDPTNGAPIYLDKNGNKTEVYKAADAVPLNKTDDPPIKGGASIKLTYQHFDIGVDLTYIHGMSRLDLTNFYVNAADVADRYNNQSAAMLNVWTTPGQNTSIPGAQYTAEPTSRDVQTSDYLKIRNISIGYTIPVKKYISQVHIFANGLNLWTFTKWKGFDPEDANDIAQYEYPASRIITLGTTVSFK